MAKIKKPTVWIEISFLMAKHQEVNQLGLPMLPSNPVVWAAWEYCVKEDTPVFLPIINWTQKEIRGASYGVIKDSLYSRVEHGDFIVLDQIAPTFLDESMVMFFGPNVTANYSKTNPRWPRWAGPLKDKQDKKIRLNGLVYKVIREET